MRVQHHASCFHRIWRFALLSSLLCLITASTGRAADWPAFRGPTGNGIAEGTGYALEWSKEKNIRWSVAMPIRGNESPIVSNGRVFVTSAAANGTQRTLHCFDRADGKAVWTKPVTFDIVEKTHQTNPFGAATPASDGERVVVWHGSAGLFCYDFEGTELWKRDLGQVGHIWGYGSSPVIHEGLVYLNFGPGKEQYLVALELETGEEVWKFDEPGGNNDRGGKMTGSWSTPVIAAVGDRFQLICSMPTRVVSLDPATGTLNWSCDGLDGRNGNLVYTSPVIGDGFGIAMGGYTGPALAFKLDGEGDVTETHRLWHATAKNPQRIGSGIIVGDSLFMANAGPGLLQCLDVATGEERWKDRGPGGNFWSSMVLAEGRLYATNQKGTALVLAPNAEQYEKLGENSLGEPSNSTPAFSDGDIFLRTSKMLYAITKSP
jgi:outer membrane protein assembly factor BamB